MNCLKKSIISILLTITFIANVQVYGFSVTGRIMMHGNVHPYESSISLRTKNYYQMMKHYQAKRRLYHTQSYLVSGIEYTAKSLASVGGALTTGGNPILMALGGQVLGDAIASQGNKVRELIYSEMSNYLDEGLKQTILRESRIDLERLTGQPQDKARNVITKYPEIFDFKHLPGARSEEKELMQEAAVQVLADKLASESFKSHMQDLRIEANKEGLKRVNKSQREYRQVLKGHINSYRNFKVTVAKNLATIAHSSWVILDKVEKNMEGIASNSDQINLLQASLFKKMSGQEKVNALVEGWFPDMKKSDRESQVQLHKNEADIQTALLNIEVAASNLPNAIRLFTNDPKTIEDVTKVSQVTTGIMAIVKANAVGPFSTVMVGLGVMGGLLGGGGNSKVESQRHEQVMFKFGKIIDNQIKISKQISASHKSLAEGQKLIYKLMFETAMELVRLGQRLDTYHSEQMREINLVKSYTLANMDLLRDLANKDPNKCKDFFQLKLGETSDIRFIDKFGSYDKLREHFSSHRDLFKPCNHGLSYILTKQDFNSNIHSLLLTKSYADHFNEVEVHWANREIYLPARDYYHKNKTKNQPSAYPELIHVEALKDYVNMAIELYPYMLIMDDPQEPSIVQNLENHRANPFIVDRVFRLLSGSLEVIDEAILQQEVIAGHGWIEPFANKLMESARDKTDESLRSIIQFNPIFQANLARVLIERRSKKTSSPYIYYDSLLNGKEAYPFFENFMGDRFLPEFLEDKWQINLGLQNENGVLRIDFPDLETLVHSKWNYTADILTLHELRHRLVDHLALVTTYLN